MAKIVSARAYSNNEIAFIAWSLDEAIDGCVGFELTRIDTDSGEEVAVAAWVPFEGQHNREWLPQTTSVWPVQRLMWRDLTVRKRRLDTERRPGDVHVKYRVRAVGKAAPGLPPVTSVPEKTYEGPVIDLAYLGDAVESNITFVSTKHGNVRAAFTNGILSAQWLEKALNADGKTVQNIRDEIARVDSPLRAYLTGDVLGFLREFLERDGKERVSLALYELADAELQEVIRTQHKRARLILSNTSKNKAGVWDEENAPFREELVTLLGASKTDRMFNNGHIGHNKFAVFGSSEVMTGSTNWTSSGLCAQSNNAVVIESDDLAGAYLDYWQRLREDSADFAAPDPAGHSTTNKQGAKLRQANSTPVDVDLDDGTHITFWASPNTKRTTTDRETRPPDLVDLLARMENAKEAILFAVFLPSQSGKTGIVGDAVDIGRNNPDILVYGAVSDPTAMPNYVPKTKDEGGNVEDPGASPPTYDRLNVHVVRAAALVEGDLVGDFEKEILKPSGAHAIIHDKIVVVDPLSDDGFVAMGSHNLGYKASYENDENLLIISNNKSLVQAYAVHVLDLYDHYRFRAALLDMKNKGVTAKDGFLVTDDSWLGKWMGHKGDLSRYLSG
jgi:phosphatidylserine/phosphatidylglycerophosphate/cardiolipin synthase-like enzyme